MMARHFSYIYTTIVWLLINTSFADAAWNVEITNVYGQTVEFSSGSEPGSETKVEVYDKCRLETATRNFMGDFYPSSTVAGIQALGSATSVSFSFLEGINENSLIYTAGDANTAKVEFCVEVGIFNNGALINFAEVKLTYNVDLVTNFASLTGYAVTGAEAYAAADKSYSFDGTLQAFFCDPSTKQELVDDGTVLNQGSTLHLCFTVPAGNFQIADVKDLMIKNGLADEPNQNIISNSVIDTPTYAEKTCYDASDQDINVCVVSFLLKAAFYDYNRMTLTGEGNVILEFGGAGRARRQLRYRLLTNHDEEKVAHVTVKAMEMMFAREAGSDMEENKPTGSSISVPLAVAGAVAVVAICLMMTGVTKFCVRRKRVARRDEVLEWIQKRNRAEMDCSATQMSHETMDMTMCRTPPQPELVLIPGRKAYAAIKSIQTQGGGEKLIRLDSGTSCLSDSAVFDFTSSIKSAFNVPELPIDPSGEEKLHGSISSISSGHTC